MSDDYIRVLNIVGLISNLAGVLILFRWGTPFRLENGGHSFLGAPETDNAGIALDHIYTVCGYVGLVLLILGTVLQIMAALIPPTHLQ